MANAPGGELSVNSAFVENGSRADSVASSAGGAPPGLTAPGEVMAAGLFAELVEFVRVGAQLVHEELAEVRTPPVPRPPASAALH